MTQVAMAANKELAYAEAHSQLDSGAELPSQSIYVGIEPTWTNTSDIALAMSLSNGRVSWSGRIQGHPGTSSIVATYTLERMNTNGSWSHVNSWPNLRASSSILTSSGNVLGSSGAFRLTVVTTVTRNGHNETIRHSIERRL